MTKKNNINLCVSIIFSLITFVLLVTIYLVIEKDKVKDYLTDQGYRIEKLEFTGIISGGNVYRAHTDDNGDLITYWEIIYTGYFGNLYIVQPYPIQANTKIVDNTFHYRNTWIWNNHPEEVANQ